MSHYHAVLNLRLTRQFIIFCVNPRLLSDMVWEQGWTPEVSSLDLLNMTKYVSCWITHNIVAPLDLPVSDAHQYDYKTPSASSSSSSSAAALHSHNAMPVHPDVRYKRLPFYDHIAELLKTSSLGRFNQATVSPSPLCCTCFCQYIYSGMKMRTVWKYILEMPGGLMNIDCGNSEPFHIFIEPNIFEKKGPSQ